MMTNDKNFRHLIRYYNNNFSFATFNANIQHDPNQKAIYNLKIQGQVCHNLPNSLIPQKGEDPSNGQLYIYDDETSVEKRLKKNSNLVEQQVKSISSVLKNCNPYVKNYKSLYQICSKKNCPTIKCIFCKRIININIDIMLH